MNYPAMVALITDAITAKPISLHLTYIMPDGSAKAPVERPKILLKGHRKSGGVIRLVDDAEVTMGLGIAEGIESSLSVMKSGWKPVWAAIDAGNIKTFPVLPIIDYLTIFADKDIAGMRAAQECEKRWLEAGRKAIIVSPKNIGDDWNDVIARAGI